MPRTYSQILLHAVFSTKNREPLIQPTLQDRLYRYMGGIVRAKKGVLYTIGGMPDHVHLLFRWRTDDAIANLIRTVKSRSTSWVYRTFPKSRTFAWQKGYAVFSVSTSAKEKVQQYIERQAIHHKRRTFKCELLALLRAHHIEFDEKEVFE